MKCGLSKPNLLDNFEVNKLLTEKSTNSCRTLPSLLFFANAEGFLPAEIAHDISGYYNILCMNVMHRPKEVSLISPHLKWYKWYGTSSWLTTGSLSLKEEYDWNRGIKCLQVVMTEMINPTDFAEVGKINSKKG